MKKKPYFVSFEIKRTQSSSDWSGKKMKMPIILFDERQYFPLTREYYDTVPEFTAPVLTFPPRYPLLRSVGLITYVGRNFGEITDAWLPRGTTFNDLRVFAAIEDDVCGHCNLGCGRTKNWPTHAEREAESPCGLVCPHQRELYKTLFKGGTLRHNLIIRHLVWAGR
ncbi:MAG: hypothetical protein LBT45_01155 [Rickettsiales bacterium]|jgi:hypothetical protein|nr:hypothetical protein [Rickettsiales bacterium]